MFCIPDVRSSSNVHIRLLLHCLVIHEQPKKFPSPLTATATTLAHVDIKSKEKNQMLLHKISIVQKIPRHMHEKMLSLIMVKGMKNKIVGMFRKLISENNKSNADQL